MHTASLYPWQLSACKISNPDIHCSFITWEYANNLFAAACTSVCCIGLSNSLQQPDKWWLIHVFVNSSISFLAVCPIRWIFLIKFRSSLLGILFTNKTIMCAALWCVALSHVLGNELHSACVRWRSKDQWHDNECQTFCVFLSRTKYSPL